MSPISLSLNLLVAVLLVLTLGFGWRLERRLKKLRDSQQGFTSAVAELDRASKRAEAGLTELRGATEETLDLLLGRIDKARELAARLEKLSAEAEAIGARAQTPPARSALESLWARTSAAGLTGPERPAAARAVEEADALVLTLSEDAIIPVERPLRLEPRATPRSRVTIDDDLFDLGPRLASGGRRA
jgi:soluble cytochrome b562